MQPHRYERELASIRSKNEELRAALQDSSLIQSSPRGTKPRINIGDLRPLHPLDSRKRRPDRVPRGSRRGKHVLRSGKTQTLVRTLVSRTFRKTFSTIR